MAVIKQDADFRRLNIVIEPELHRLVKIEAAKQDITVSEYVRRTLAAAVGLEEKQDGK